MMLYMQSTLQKVSILLFLQVQIKQLDLEICEANLILKFFLSQFGEYIQYVLQVLKYVYYLAVGESAFIRLALLNKNKPFKLANKGMQYHKFVFLKVMNY